MSSLNSPSHKIQKSPKQSQFICGCSRSYQSYAALRLHVNKKHNSIMPFNTLATKPVRPPLETNVLPGRPAKAGKNIDDQDDADEAIEVAQNDLMSFLGEKLMITRDPGRKTPLELVVEKVTSVDNDTETKDKWLTEIQEEAKKVLSDYEAKDRKIKHLDLDEDLVKLDPTNRPKLVAWFLVWLMEIYVQIEFVSDITWVFSKIWKVLDKTELEVEDLDNKLVWKQIMKEAEGLNDGMTAFRRDSAYLFSFIEKTCKVIGKVMDKDRGS